MSNILTELAKQKTNLEKLQYLVQTQKSNYAMYLTRPKFGLKFLLDWIIEKTPLLKDPIYELKTKIYWILSGITQFPKCEICGDELKNINVYSVQQGYKKQICTKKSCVNKYAAKKRVAKMLENYGVTTNFARTEVIEKITQTNIERFGNACPANNVDIREQIKHDNLEKFGCEYYSSTDECKEKVRKTVLEEYGVDCVFKSAEVKAKSKQTSLEKYGTEYPAQSEIVKENTKKSLIAEYGENYAKILWGNNGNVGQSKRAYNQYILKSQYVEPMFSLEYYIEQRKQGNNNFLFKCKKCGKMFYSYWDNGATKACPYCKITEIGSSKKEYELYTQVITCLNGQYLVKHNDRSLLINKELDVYIPSKKLAIEFDGLYWHNDDNQQNYKYHLEKTLLCEKHDVHLIHVFENEWNYKQDIVMSRIKNLLGIYDATVYARKCEIREVTSKESKIFQEANHIQGAVNAKVHLGLYYGNELISLMTFGKCRFNKNYEWELLRFCNKLGYHVPGAAGKLLKHFEKTCHPKSLISYADRRWSRGKLYEALGFKLDHVSAPNYWYFKSYDCCQLESRVNFQKHKLNDKLPTFDQSLSEVENMKNNGYHRIFDCGNLVYIKVYDCMI